MNSVSWLIYFASVMDRLGTLVLLLTVLGGVALLGFLIVTLCSIATYGERYGGDVGKDKYLWPAILASHSWRWIVACLVVLHVANVFRPSQQTLYAIAASEVGEQIIKSEAVSGLANDATKALRQWIRTQIEPEAKK